MPGPVVPLDYTLGIRPSTGGGRINATTNPTTPHQRGNRDRRMLDIENRLSGDFAPRLGSHTANRLEPVSPIRRWVSTIAWRLASATRSARHLLTSGTHAPGQHDQGKETTTDERQERIKPASAPATRPIRWHLHPLYSCSPPSKHVPGSGISPLATPLSTTGARKLQRMKDRNG
jgi:hypothetical protein